MKECWYQNPAARLTALRIKKTLANLEAEKTQIWEEETINFWTERTLNLNEEKLNFLKKKKNYEGKLLKYDKVHKAISAIKTCSNLYFIKSFSIKYLFFSFWKCNIFLGHLLSNWEFLIFICKHYQILSNSKRKRSFN